MCSVPEPYLDAWARLQCQKPAHVTVEQWRQAIDQAGRFLDQWEAALSNSAGMLVICLTCRAMASRAASFGSLEAKAFRQLDLGAWLRKTAASSTGLKINQGKPKGVPGGYQ